MESALPYKPFDLLPNELQESIWEYVLPEERILHVRLSPTPLSSQQYSITLVERKPISKAFVINKASRATAKKFYRVNLPCHFRFNERVGQGTFYFKPEWDTLEIRDPFMKCFAQFAQDLWLNDHKRVGLINLMVGSLRSRQRINDADTLLQQALMRLQRVIFVPEFHLPEFQLTNNTPDYSPVQAYATLYRHRCAFTPTFATKFIRRDADQEFVQRHLPAGIDFDRIEPQTMLLTWYFKLAALGIAHDHQKVDYRLMLPYGAISVAERDHYDLHYHDSGSPLHAAVRNNNVPHFFELLEQGEGQLAFRPVSRGPHRFTMGWSDGIEQMTTEELMDLRAPGFWLIPSKKHLTLVEPSSQKRNMAVTQSSEVELQRLDTIYFGVGSRVLSWGISALLQSKPELCLFTYDLDLRPPQD